MPPSGMPHGVMSFNDREHLEPMTKSADDFARQDDKAE
jgi:hypothetical protein